MEVRCTSCNKLFRVSDDKIVGSGIKFSCTRCHETVKITRQAFEHYLQSKASPVVQAMPAAAAIPAAPAAVGKAVHLPDPAPPAGDASLSDFDLSDPATAAATMGRQEEVLPAPPEPAVKAAPGSAPTALKRTIETGKTQPALRADPSPKLSAVQQPGPKPGPELKVPPKPVAEPVHAAGTGAAAAGATASPAAPPIKPKEAESFPRVLDAAPAQTGSAGRKLGITAVVLILLVAAGAGVKFYLGGSVQKPAPAVSQVASPEGLQVLSQSGVIDPAKGDLIVSGVVENSTDKPKPAWLVIVDVYDAQGGVLAKAKLLNGKQLYTRRDYDILAKRGEDVQAIKMKNLQDQGVSIPPKGTVNFEIRILEPPIGVASFNTMLKPFDPVQLYKEMAEEQK